MEEPTLNAAPRSPRETEEKNRPGALLPLFLLLLFFLLASFCIVGFRLGRTTDTERLGALIDTIVLAPDPSPLPSGQPGPDQRMASIQLLGLVRYTDGTPFTKGSVELRSQPRTAGLNQAGHFRFDQVEVGDHTLTVLDQSGKALTSRAIRVTRDAEDDAYMDYELGVCVLHIQLMTVQVDVELTLEGAPDGGLDVRLAGSAEGPSVPVLQPSAPPAAETGRPGGTAAPTLAPAPPGGTPSATPGGTPGVTPTAAPSAVPTASTSALPTAGPGPTPTQAPSPVPTASPKPSREPDDDDDNALTPAPDLIGDTQVYHGESGVTWSQQAEIDLFRPLDGSANRLIAPGSEGHYLFRLENGRSGRVRFTLAIQEGSFHVPLEYRITDGKRPLVEYSPWKTASVEAETVSDGLELEAGEDGYYRIEWRWPFDGDDAVDTALGGRADRTYTLKLTIRAEDAP